MINMKAIKEFIVILLLFFPAFKCESEEQMLKREAKENAKTSKRLLNELVETMRRDYNLIVDKEKYEVSDIGLSSGYVYERSYDFGIARKNGIKYKSKYFKEKEKIYYAFNSNGVIEMEPGNSFINDLFTILNFGFRPYILNELLYDKTRGNDFERIKKIFDQYELKYKIKYTDYDGGWRCGIIEENVGGEGMLNFVNDKNCYYGYDAETHTQVEKGMTKYFKKFKEYFSVERNLETIDWEEYMKYNGIYPVLEFEINGISEEEIKVLRRRIKPYFNKDILYIKLYNATPEKPEE